MHLPALPSQPLYARTTHCTAKRSEAAATDCGVGEEEAAATIAAYQELRPVDRRRLAWQRRCWEAFWRAHRRRLNAVSDTQGHSMLCPY